MLSHLSRLEFENGLSSALRVGIRVLHKNQAKYFVSLLVLLMFVETATSSTELYTYNLVFDLFLLIILFLSCRPGQRLIILK